MNRHERDVTRALKLARELMVAQDSYDSSDPTSGDDRFPELIQVLEDMDARTGRRDPTKRKAKR